MLANADPIVAERFIRLSQGKSEQASHITEPQLPKEIWCNSVPDLARTLGSTCGKTQYTGSPSLHVTVQGWMTHTPGEPSYGLNS
jgi:hypothetical protein